MARNGFIAAAFDKGQVPTISVVNQAKGNLGFNLNAVIAALQKQVDRDFAPVWGTPCKLMKASTIAKGNWAIVILDTPDVSGAAGYHDLTPAGLPLSKVFLSAGGVTVTMSHELLEMLVDPAINMMTDGPNAQWAYAYETADPCEEDTYSIDGIEVSDFVYPSYFETFRKPKSTQFDYLNLITKPFQLRKGGYQSVWKNGKWTSVFGSAAKAKRFAKEDRRGHRSESRGKILKTSKGR